MANTCLGPEITGEIGRAGAGGSREFIARKDLYPFPGVRAGEVRERIHGMIVKNGNGNWRIHGRPDFRTRDQQIEALVLQHRGQVGIERRSLAGHRTDDFAGSRREPSSQRDNKAGSGVKVQDQNYRSVIIAG